MDEWNNKLPERLPFSKKRLPKKVIFSYILDYVIIFALIGTFVVIDRIEPFHQPFSLQNYTLHYPFAKKERVTVFMAGVIAVAFPAAVIAFYTLVIDGLFSHQTPMPTNRGGLKRLTGRYRLKDRLWELNCGLLGLMLSACAAFSITGALKNAIGKPRPDIIDRCMVKEGIDRDPGFGLSTIAICTQPDDHILQDGFKSFPSAHSSVSFAGLFYLSLYLAAKLHVLDSKGEVWKSVIVLMPSLGAALVAGSRIMDARHHPFDVLSGSLMGILVAWGSYRQYFPPVSETWRKGRAYPIRSWGVEPTMPPRADDVQPLRRARTDEEQVTSSSFSSDRTIPGGDEHGGNVFRQQISQSQRRRHQDGQFGPIQRTDTPGSTYSTQVAGYRGQLPGPSPYASDPRRQDTYDYSSSDDDNSYELQQTHPHSNPQGVTYNPVAGTMTDTGYHPPTGAAIPRQTTGDVGDQRGAAPVPPPHNVGTAVQQV